MFRIRVPTSKPPSKLALRVDASKISVSSTEKTLWARVCSIAAVSAAAHPLRFDKL